MNFLTELYPHQQAAVEKLSKLKVGALYMEQGTGKTRTTLELIRRRFCVGKINRVLWLCPCSIKQNLQSDIIYHCGVLPEEIVIRGIESLSSSDKLYNELLKLVEDNKVYLIVDESNLVKNINAKRTARIVKLSMKCTYKLILNGTPASRNESDLFAQWYVLDWRILGYKTFWGFASNHLEFKKIVLPDGREVVTDQITRVLNIDYLSEKIAPYTFQILKADCLDLPKKHYYKQHFSLTDEQSIIYFKVKEQYLLAVEEIRPDTIYKLFTALQHVVSGRCVLTPPDKKMKTAPMFEDFHDNPRIGTLSEILNDFIGVEKCIIFVKYQSEIDTIAELLEERGQSFKIFTGKVPQKQRQENLTSFRESTQFLIANKSCGAYGLNLQFCRNVIFYSNDFDLATRLQSEDRVHRIGQTQEVRIFDIYAEGTIDELIVNCLERKENMIDAFKRGIKEQGGTNASLSGRRRFDGGTQTH